MVRNLCSWKQRSGKYSEFLIFYLEFSLVYLLSFWNLSGAMKREKVLICQRTFWLMEFIFPYMSQPLLIPYGICTRFKGLGYASKSDALLKGRSWFGPMDLTNTQQMMSQYLLINCWNYWNQLKKYLLTKGIEMNRRWAQILFMTTNHFIKANKE